MNKHKKQVNFKKSGGPDDDELNDLINSKPDEKKDVIQSNESFCSHVDVKISETDAKISPELLVPVLQNNLDVEPTTSRENRIDQQQNNATEILEAVDSKIDSQVPAINSLTELSNQTIDGNGGAQHGNPKFNRGVITNKEEVLAVRAKRNVSKLSLGNGLLVFFEKNERISFHYRLSENGRDTTRKIGDFDSMSIEKAREEAKKFRDFALQERKLRSNQSFKRMLISPTEINAELSSNKSSSKKHKCFDSMNDFLKFIEYLLSDNGIDEKIKASILLLFMLPIHPRELFKAQWKDLQNDGLLVIPVTTLTSNERSPAPFLVTNVTVCLSSQAQLIFKILNPDNRMKYQLPDEFILQRHLCLNKKYDEKFLTKWMAENFVSYKIVPSHFVNFFEDMALESDLFNEDVVHDFVKFASLPQKGSIEFRKLTQMQLLIQWWGDLLEMRSPSIKKFIRPGAEIFSK